MINKFNTAALIFLIFIVSLVNKDLANENKAIRMELEKIHHILEICRD